MMNVRCNLLRAALVGALVSFFLVDIAYAAPRSYDFGRILLGTEINRLPKWARDEGGCEMLTNNFADCWFTDSTGIEYAVFEGVLTQKIVSLSAYKGYAPYGLRPGDTQEKALSKIESRLGLQLSCYSHMDENGCEGNIQDDKIGPVAVSVSFDKSDRIKEVKISTGVY